jgi:hypothetical protein
MEEREGEDQTHGTEKEELPVADVSQGSGLMDEQQREDGERGKEEEDDRWMSAHEPFQSELREEVGNVPIAHRIMADVRALFT